MPIRDRMLLGLAMSHSDSTLLLGLEAEVLQPARSRVLCKTEIRWADPSPLDRFATGHGRCLDWAGHRMPKCQYTVWTRAGMRCWRCWRLRTWEPV